jgi:hypothetical protein
VTAKHQILISVHFVPGFYNRRNGNLSCHPSQTRLFEIVYCFNRSISYHFITTGSKSCVLTPVLLSVKSFQTLEVQYKLIIIRKTAHTISITWPYILLIRRPESQAQNKTISTGQERSRFEQAQFRTFCLSHSHHVTQQQEQKVTKTST